uniref:Uncharacterized protein n=1 Tax=Octopus bimaculoides TaxID=37653 RepID=A0A0L8FNJ2_OCTBM
MKLTSFMHCGTLTAFLMEISNEIVSILSTFLLVDFLQTFYLSENDLITINTSSLSIKFPNNHILSNCSKYSASSQVFVLLPGILLIHQLATDECPFFLSLNTSFNPV